MRPRQGVEIAGGSAHGPLDDLLAFAPDEPRHVARALAAREGVEHVGQGLFAVVTDHGVEAGQLAHELFPAEGADVPAARDVAAIASLAERAEEERVVVDVVLERDAQPDEIRLLRQCALDGVVEILAVRVRDDAHVVALGARVRREVAESQVFLLDRADERGFHFKRPPTRSSRRRITFDPMTSLIPLGTTGPRVFPLALGCMGMSGMYGTSSDDESVRTIHAAIERGVTLLDTLR
ncbi:MAG TPA: hypothetical protein VF316_08185, partial [Polyangiaceae bacterium]